MIKSVVSAARKITVNISFQIFSSAFVRNMAELGEPKCKQLCVSDIKIIKIGTHDGVFHCDEVLACYLLKTLPEYKNSKIIRTRNQAKLDGCDIVVDVGGTFDPTTHRYDHHQRSFNASMKTLNQEYPWTTKLSSSGLIYFYFGHRILAGILNRDVDDSKTKNIFKKVYENFLEEVDAIDNGISVCSCTPRYTISSNLSARVKMMNPQWNESNPDVDAYFNNAMMLVGDEFMNAVLYYSNTWWPARGLVVDALRERFSTYTSGEILELAEGSCPWKDHLLCLEDDLGIYPKIKFVIYQDSNGHYRVQCVPVRADSFESRLPLPEEWRGLRDVELSEISDIPDCIFVHASGFIGGNRSKNGALRMAIDTLRSIRKASGDAI